MKRIAYFLAAAALTCTFVFGYNLAKAVIPLPAQTGPYLGDSTVNLYTLTNAIGSDNQLAYTTVTGISTTTVSQATCTTIGNSPTPGAIPAPAAIYLASTATAATGAVCLPTAYAGRELYIYNNTGQTVNFYSNLTSVGAATDTINNVAGTTALAVVTIGANAGAAVVNCISMPGSAAGVAPAGLNVGGGAWACQRGN